MIYEDTSSFFVSTTSSLSIQATQLSANINLSNISNLLLYLQRQNITDDLLQGVVSISNTDLIYIYCVCVCAHVYVVYEDTNLFNYMGMT